MKTQNRAGTVPAKYFGWKTKSSQNTPWSWKYLPCTSPRFSTFLLFSNRLFCQNKLSCVKLLIHNSQKVKNTGSGHIGFGFQEGGSESMSCELRKTEKLSVSCACCWGRVNPWVTTDSGMTHIRGTGVVWGIVGVQAAPAYEQAPIKIRGSAQNSFREGNHKEQNRNQGNRKRIGKNQWNQNFFSEKIQKLLQNSS